MWTTNPGWNPFIGPLALSQRMRVSCALRRPRISSMNVEFSEVPIAFVGELGVVPISFTVDRVRGAGRDTGRGGVRSFRALRRNAVREELRRDSRSRSFALGASL